MKKFALVTGGSRGIGRAVCVKLATRGYNILINYNANYEAAVETKQLVENEKLPYLSDLPGKESPLQHPSHPLP